MNLQQLHYIIAVDKFRSFAKAAENRGVTQPTLSKMIANLKLFTNAQVTEGPTGTAEFRALFPESNLFDRTPAASVKYLSCSINANGYPSGMQLNPGDPISAAFSQYAKATNPTVIRPMITIFE